MIAFQDKEQTRATYDFLSRFYDQLSGSAEARLRKQAIELLDLQAEDYILEIGCATGNASIEMGKRVKSGGFVIGLDLSLKMLEAARRKIDRNGLKKSIGLLCGEAQILPVVTGAVRGVLMSFTLELFNEVEIESVLLECRRVLCRGGRLCVLAMSKCQPRAGQLRLYEWFHQHFPAWVDCRPILLEQTIARNGFNIRETRQGNLFGLPVEIVLAESLNESNQS